MIQVMISVCVECLNNEQPKRTVIGCHVSNRTVKKMYCRDKNCDRKCPIPTDEDSHGLCKKCFDVAFARINRRRNHKPVENERRLSA